MQEDWQELSPEDALAALALQVAFGADEALEDAPIDRFGRAAVAASAEAVPPPGAGTAPAAGLPAETPFAPSPPPAPAAEPLPDTSSLAAACADLAGLRAAMADFEGCALKKGARNLVFADGMPGARVMIVGEAPGREEDRQGLPFVGPSGQLLDRMFDAIGLSRRAKTAQDALYITNTLPWRPPQNRDPSADETAMMKPFLLRHIALARPQLIVTMGNPATKTLLDTTTGITRMRGTWAQLGDLPVMPMFHPAALLRDPLKKREAWADLKAVRARLAMLG